MNADKIEDKSFTKFKEFGRAQQRDIKAIIGMARTMEGRKAYK
jgi:hypothetical protein